MDTSPQAPQGLDPEESQELQRKLDNGRIRAWGRDRSINYRQASSPNGSLN